MIQMKNQMFKDEESERVYERVESSISGSYVAGSVDKTCKRDAYETSWKWALTLDSCSICYCVCDDDMDFNKTGILSERRFYTKLILADTVHN